MRTIIVEDTEEIAECMQQSLRDMGITSDRFTQGKLFRHALSLVDYDLAVVDLNLPDSDGLDLIKSLRKTMTMPVLIVSARTSIDARVGGLDFGADDYLVKPFDLNEFEARVRALLRRSSSKIMQSISFGDLTFNQTSREFFLSDLAIDLPPRERAVLEILIREENRIISKERIADKIFNFDDEAGTSSIEVYIHRLRKKLANSNIEIATRRGLGYELKLA